MTFRLDDRLAADSLAVGRLPLSALRLMGDATYPWLLLVPERPGLTELIDLDAPARGQLIEEIAAVSGALKDLTAPAKLNVGALGNRVRQLHVHVIARREDDPAWPDPVWGKGPPAPYPPGAAEAFIARLRAHPALAAAGLREAG